MIWVGAKMTEAAEGWCAHAEREDHGRRVQQETVDENYCQGIPKDRFTLEHKIEVRVE
jgi:hypothetical protein